MIQACSARHIASIAPLTKDQSLLVASQVASQMEAPTSRFIGNLSDETHKQKCGLTPAAHMHIYKTLVAAICVKKRCTFKQMFQAQVQPIGTERLSHANTVLRIITVYSRFLGHKQYLFSNSTA